MKLPELCIRRPVLTLVLNFLILLVGSISYTRLAVREYPNIDEPVVTVDTTYTGASAEIIESQITQPLEETLAGIDGLNTLTSISRPEDSKITLRFRITKDPEAAANDVRDRVSRSRNKLPDGIDDPTIAKVEADAQPIIYLAFSSDRFSPLQISDYADRYVKPRLQNIDGVSEARLLGERRYAMRIWLDPLKLAALKLTPDDVISSLSNQNLEVPAGRIENTKREFTVLVNSDLATPDQFNKLVLKNVNGFAVTLKDVGYAQLGPEDERIIARFNGNKAIAIGIVKQATANPLTISQEVQNALHTLRTLLPEGMHVDVAYDSSVFIDRSIKEVYKTILEAVVLVVLVIFLFLRNFRSILIPLVTIPISLIGALTLMYIFGFTINTLTLLAIVLAIGLVVDDAIVMLENIYHHIEKGTPPIKAAIIGSREITYAIIAMTITLAAVYTPMVFSQGRTGKLFIEFALTLAGSVLVSGFVALTLSPMMCSRLLREVKNEGNFSLWIEKKLEQLRNSYEKWLSISIHNRSFVLGAAGAILIGCGVLFHMTPSELAPIEDRGTIIGIGVSPEGSTIGYTSTAAQSLENIYQKIPEIDRYFVVAGYPVVSQVITFSRLKPWEERSRKQQDIVQALFPQFFSIPSILAFPINPASLGQSAIERPVQFVIKSLSSYEHLDKVVTQVLQKVRTSPALVNIDCDLKLNQPQLNILLDREKINNVGADVAAIGRTLETLLGGKKATRFKQDGKQYDVIVQVSDNERLTPQQINNIFIKGKNDVMIQLSNLVRIEETVAPKDLNRFDQLRSATISATVGEGHSLEQALKILEEATLSLGDKEIQIDHAGESREFKESSKEIYFIFLLALIFIYLVLAAQYESFRDPLIIIFSVPLSTFGALLAMKLNNITLNIYSQVGLVTLIGLVTKHGILIVEYANHIRLQGKNRIDAVCEAASLRLRPILMTTGAMVLGAVPLAFASGAGGESRNAIGWVIVGGLTIGTLFTLFIVPIVYTFLAAPHLKKEID
ncbi:MAG: multidrug transporter AcrB [Caedibacter sp. 38-128]|nr:efflux RND transporter permease subunit [Holosporales bacterium]OJX07657.1 MAG: multidrug transporter AcrB [Caedibacter sp. 38-128]